MNLAKCGSIRNIVCFAYFLTAGAFCLGIDVFGFSGVESASTGVSISQSVSLENINWKPEKCDGVLIIGEGGHHTESIVFIPRYGNVNAYHEQLHDTCVIEGILANEPGIAGWFVEWNRYQPDGSGAWSKVADWLKSPYLKAWEACAASGTLLVVKPWVCAGGVPEWARACDGAGNWCNYPADPKYHIDFFQTLAEAMNTVPGLHFIMGAWNEVDLRWDDGPCNTGVPHTAGYARENHYEEYLASGSVWSGGLERYHALRAVTGVEYHNDAVLPWAHLPDGCSIDRLTWMRKSFESPLVKYGIAHRYMPIDTSGEEYADSIYDWLDAMNRVTGPDDLDSPHYPPRLIVGEASTMADSSPPLADIESQAVIRRWYLGLWRDPRISPQFEGILWHGGSCATDGAPGIPWWSLGPYQATLGTASSEVTRSEHVEVSVQLNKPVHPSDSPIEVGVSTVKGSAVPGKDYVSGAVKIVFNSGEQYKTVKVLTMDTDGDDCEFDIALYISFRGDCMILRDQIIRHTVTLRGKRNETALL